jgi:exopolysaccharide biosynthesis predicted pyruvyltransferase EpsI
MTADVARGAGRLALIAGLQSRIHQSLGALIARGERFAILDFPDIRNCGDSAIWLGEIAYLDRHGLGTPAYVSRIGDFDKAALERAVPSGPIFIHGGGNFGDIWIGHQNFRERIIGLFPERPIVQFPQSIHYDSAQRAKQTARIIGRHKRFTLLVRDEESRHYAEKAFDCRVILCPDMAFCIGAVDKTHPSLPILAMLRADKERVSREPSPIPADIPVEDWITESALKVRMAKVAGAAKALLNGRPQDMRYQLLHAAANNRFNRGIHQLARAETLITDRLHVHICSILLGLPHAVLDNSYGKIRRFMDAFSGGSGLSYRAQSIADAIEWARDRARRLDPTPHKS